ncbi:conserved membrane protein of unknown function [Tepidanaerobacter acetatoxydans Re1]|uniref:Uncharacterized protein n=1 Tax=Tepidanaerobacter acetatoxydans (strain DSM 21804 / JCM 16047 / Re1) TaxID=1209989 RepID=F4LUZ1_TEPAE|nr:hypothetical protein [Tepidanaerobacter acetatoxydans]AEE91517.1 hypothetical protein TepRe1_1371 [Tepidanaerobacter acetatoxydans Re1]CDI40710.1 conserved membrane protein of unknown function [Tepidanaerobacter acetatoxydans Re1]
MFIDVVGILLTVIIISPRYCFIVLLLCFMESVFTILISMVLESNITEVIAGGIFTTVAGPNNKDFFLILSPLFFFMLGLGLHKDKKIPWIDLINPIADFKSPLPALMIKTSLFRIMVIYLIN